MEAISAIVRIVDLERRRSPLLTTILKTLDWHKHIIEDGGKPWITCRDREGNRYTLYPVYDDEGALLPDHFTLYRHEDNVI